MDKRMLPVLLVGFVLATGTALAKGSSHTDTELRYAEGLLQLGLPDFAGMVLDRLEDDPDGTVRLKQFQVLLMTEEGLARAEKEVANAPADEKSTWHMKLALADAYYAWGKHSRALDMYDAFIEHFAGTSEAGETELLVNVTHRYAQMLTMMGQHEKSLAAYRKLDLDKVHRLLKRQILAEQLELILRICEKGEPKDRAEHLAAAEKIADDLMLVQDLWGGKAIVAKAHVLLLRGERDKARKMLEASLPTLVELDRRLQEESN